MARRDWLVALRILILALLVPLALASTLPAYAKVVAGHAVHVCRCEARGGHSTCACPICHPDREELRISEESIRGRCGDEDVAFGAAIDVVIANATVALVAPPTLHATLPPLRAETPRVLFIPPPTPPPRIATSDA